MILYLPLFPVAGFTFSPWLIIMQKKRMTDTPLLLHEQCHQEQMRRDGWLKFWSMYLLNPEKRLEYELEAYAVQIRNGAVLDICAKNIAVMYCLNISKEEAKERLQKLL